MPSCCFSPHCWFSLTTLTLFTLIQAQVHATSNVLVRVVAGNLSSGTFQRYESPGLNILKGLKPDIVALQEFNVSNQFGINTTSAVSHMIATTFGTNFAYFRETNAGYSIPNGVISRWPLLTAGSWDDPQVPDRGFAWARIDVPGTNDLYVVSVHLHSGGGATSRATEATVLKALVATNFPTNAWVILAGDFNTDTRTETAMTTFRTFLSDDRIPADQAGDPDTNANRNKPYDYLLASFSLTNALAPVAIGTNRFTNGLVFDSRVYQPLADVSPVLSSDSAANQMQHMAVTKDFNITLPEIAVPPPAAPVLSSLTFDGSAFSFKVDGTPGVNYVVQSSTNLGAGGWVSLRTNQSPFTFTEANVAKLPRRFYRAIWQP